MTLPQIITKITNLTGADTNQYSSASRLIDINIWLQKVVGMILDSSDEVDYDDPRIGDYPVLTIPLTTNRDYNIPVSEKVVKIKDVSVSYDGVNFYRARPMDDTEFDIGISTSSDATQNATIDANFSKTAPRYDIKFNSLWLYPMATSSDVASSGAIAIEWFREPLEFTTSDLTDITVVPGFDTAFHPILAYGPAYEYADSKNLPQTERLYRELQDYEMRLRKQYSSKQADRKYGLQMDYQNYK